MLLQEANHEYAFKERVWSKVKGYHKNENELVNVTAAFCNHVKFGNKE